MELNIKNNTLSIKIGRADFFKDSSGQHTISLILKTLKETEVKPDSIIVDFSDFSENINPSDFYMRMAEKIELMGVHIKFIGHPLTLGSIKSLRAHLKMIDDRVQYVSTILVTKNDSIIQIPEDKAVELLGSLDNIENYKIED